MRGAGSLKFWTATVILTLIAVLFFAGTAKSAAASGVAERESCYGELEERLVKDVRAYLDERGLTYSGVMLTRVVEPDGSRMYTLTVHHCGIGKMTAGEREELKAALEELSFEEEACGFRYELQYTGSCAILPAG